MSNSSFEQNELKTRFFYRVFEALSSFSKKELLTIEQKNVLKGKIQY